jgi:hypothetical protein
LDGQRTAIVIPPVETARTNGSHADEIEIRDGEAVTGP